MPWVLRSRTTPLTILPRASLHRFRRAGYDVQSSSRVSDAMLLMRVAHFDLLLAGPGMTASADSPSAFQAACAKLPVIELGSEFSTSHAGEAGVALLEMIKARLDAKTA